MQKIGTTTMYESNGTATILFVEATN